MSLARRKRIIDLIIAYDMIRESINADIFTIPHSEQYLTSECNRFELFVIFSK